MIVRLDAIYGSQACEMMLYMQHPQVPSIASPVIAAFSLLLREDGPHRLLFIERLIEDRTEFGTSYYEFLTHINRQLSK